MPPQIWSEDFKVHSYEVDFNKRATPEILCRFFQETAWNHAEALGVGFARLASEGKLWVLSRLLIQFDYFPLWREIIQVQTWPRPVEGPFALRDFEIFISDSLQTPIVKGSSAWLVLDATTRRPQRIDKLLSSIRATSDHRATARNPEKLSDPPRASASTPHTAFRVRNSDLDVNNHVNNARYLGWLLDSYPQQFHREHQVARFEANYLGETRVDEQLELLSTRESDLEVLHSIRSATGAEVCRARLTWLPSKLQ